MTNYTDLVKRVRAAAESMRDVGENVPIALAYINDLADAIEALQRWKDEAQEVERSWNVQAVGKLLGVAPGADIRAAIQPAIEAQAKEIERLQAQVWVARAVLEGKKKVEP